MVCCDDCIQDKALCLKCKMNPIYKDLQDYYREYEPVCPFGYTDCILDPAYIKHNSPEWYKTLYEEKTPEEVGCYCKGGRDYDS